MSENRIDPTAAPSSSSNGVPVVSPKIVPVLLAVAAVAGAVVAIAPEHTLAAKLAQGVLAALAVVGIASPGLRRR